MAQSVAKPSCIPTLLLLTRPIHLCNTFTPLGELLWFIISSWQARPSTIETVRWKSERVLSVDVERLPWWMSPQCALNTDSSSAHSKIRAEAIFIVTRVWTYFAWRPDRNSKRSTYTVMKVRKGSAGNLRGWSTPRPSCFIPRNNPVPIGIGGWVTEKVLLPKSLTLFDQNACALIFNYWLSCTDHKWW